MTLSQAKAEARRFSRRYSVWYVVETSPGIYESYAHSTDDARTVACFMNGELWIEPAPDVEAKSSKSQGKGKGKGMKGKTVQYCGNAWCGKALPGPYGTPGVSLARHDNKTLLCSDCGTREALADLAKRAPTKKKRSSK